MKTIIAIFISLLYLNISYSQIAYYDALKLSKLLDKSRHFKNSGAQKDSVFSILSKYLGNRVTSPSDFSNSSKNPFIYEYFNAAQTYGTGFSNNVGSDTAPTTGGLNVTNIADGIAQFLIKRGKEELDAAFFNQMKKFLDKHEECKILFPSTVDFLANIDPYKFAEFLQSLREAFHKDLSNLIIHLNQVIDLPKYKRINPGVRLAVRSANIVSELSQSGKSITPDSLISQIASLPWSDVNNNLGNAWKFLNIISQSLRDTGENRIWVQLSDMNQNLFDDSIALRIYIGLIYQKVSKDSISFVLNNIPIRVDSFLFKNKDNIYAISGLIENFSLLADDVDKTIDNFRSKQQKQTLTDDDYYTYISKAINILDYGFKVANTIDLGIIYDKYITIARSANDLYKNIYTKNYNNAVMNVYSILNQTFIKDSANKILPGILKYGNFMASVIKAGSPADVENAIEAAALPVGSYSIKQRSSWNLSLNGYIGYARDYNNGLYAQGIYAPVGISVSHGSRKNGVTISAFASVIDVGGIATYRLANGITDTLKQEVRLGSIFSPSAQLLIEKTKFPLALCIGWRQSPKMVYSKQNGFTTFPSKSVFNVALIIDIPIITFWNKPFEKK